MKKKHTNDELRETKELFDKYKVGNEKLENLFSIESTGLDKKINENEKLVKMINYLDVYRGIVNEDNLSYTSGKRDKINSTLVRKNDILITPTSETPLDIFNSYVIVNNFENDVVYSYHLTKLTPICNLNSSFYKMYFDTVDFRKNIFKYATGSTRFTLSKRDISNVDLPVYEIEFQNKVATLLSSIDDLIEQKNLLIKQYENHMKYIYNQCFSNTDVINTVENICNLYKGVQLNKENFIESSEYKVFNGGIEHSGYTDSYNAEAGSITISEGGASSGYIRKINEKFWSGGHNYTIAFDSKVDYNYLFHLLKFNKHKIENLAIGSTMPNIPAKSLNSLKLSYHSNEKMQKQITKLLDHYIELIKLCIDEKNKYLEFKKYHLNNIFK